MQMTVIECLARVGVTGEEALRIAAVIGSSMPVDAGVRVTREIVDAARDADVGLVALLLAQRDDRASDAVVDRVLAQREWL